MSKLVEEAKQMSDGIYTQLTDVQKNVKEVWSTLEGLIYLAKKDEIDGVRGACINMEIAIDYLIMDLKRIQEKINSHRLHSLYPDD